MGISVVIEAFLLEAWLNSIDFLALKAIFSRKFVSWVISNLSTFISGSNRCFLVKLGRGDTRTWNGVLPFCSPSSISEQCGGMLPHLLGLPKNLRTLMLSESFFSLYLAFIIFKFFLYMDLFNFDRCFVRGDYIIYDSRVFVVFSNVFSNVFSKLHISLVWSSKRVSSVKNLI